LEGKKLRKPKGHKSPDVIALDEKTEKILNVWGTHPQYESTMSAWFSRAKMFGNLDDFDRFFVRRDFTTLLNTSSKSLSYILEGHPDLFTDIAGIDRKLQVANSVVQNTVSEVLETYRNLVERTDDSARPE
jgi:hypothetical protein